MRERVGMFDLSNFYQDRSDRPRRAGFPAADDRQPDGHADRPLTYTSMLTAQGGIKCDLTVTRLGPDRFWVLTGGGTGPMDLAWLR